MTRPPAPPGSEVVLPESGKAPPRPPTHPGSDVSNATQSNNIDGSVLSESGKAEILYVRL